MDELLKDFLAETSDQLEAIGAQLVRFERDPSDVRILANIFRLVHTIRGACGFLDLRRLEKLARAAETLIVRLRDDSPDAGSAPLVLETLDRIRFVLVVVAEGRGEPPGGDDELFAKIERVAEDRPAMSPPVANVCESACASLTAPPERRARSMRISIEALENISTLVRELVSTRNNLVAIADSAGADLRAPLRRLSAVTEGLASGLRAVRTAPVDRLFAGLPRLVHEVCTTLGKRVELSLRGGETEIDHPLIETLREPLRQMIRDAIEHGIETPEERRRVGKPELGVLEIRARREDGAVCIEVADDGRRLDFDSIHESACAMGLGAREEFAELPEAELRRFVFASGPRAAADNSGRRARLEILRANVRPIGGSAFLGNRDGAGAIVELRMPLAGIAVPVFLLGAGEERFALPSGLVEKIVEFGPDADDVLIDVKGKQAIVSAGGVLPAGCLRVLMGSPARSAETDSTARVALKLRAGGASFALVADGALEAIEVCVRPLPTRPRQSPMFSGAAVLDDGSVVLMLDPVGVAEALGLMKSVAAIIAPVPRPRAPPPSAGLVVFRADGPALRAIPASVVARIIPLESERIETSEGAAAIRVDQLLVPLVGPGDGSVDPGAPSSMALLLGEGHDRLALRVDEIVDVVAVGPSDEFRGEAVDIIDPAPLFARERKRRAPVSAISAPGVLIVEPIEYFRNLIAATLTRNGYRACAVGDCDAALVALETAGFAAVLLDLGMMAETRMREIGRLRDAAAGRPSVLIGLSSHGGPSIRARAARAGLCSAVGKFDRGRLLALLDAALLETELAA